MWTLVTIVHAVVCTMLIVIVLLQTGKGADMGAVFGGSSSTVFGSSGAGTFLSRLTSGMAIVFMVTSLLLTYGSAPERTETVFDEVPAAQAPPQAAPSPAPEPGPAAPASRKGQPPTASPQAPAGGQPTP